MNIGYLKRLLFVLTLFVVLFLSGMTNKRVAVMEIGVDKTSQKYFKHSQLEAATQYLYSKLAGKMNIINQTQLKEVYQEMVAEGRVKSRKMCVDDACRIELGRNAAANYNMNSRITAFAGTCTLTVELINLKTTMSEQGEGASANFNCNVSGLQKVIDDVTRQLLNKRKTTISSTERDEKACEYAQKKGDTTVWKEYLRQFPKGLCAFVAKLAIKNSPSDDTIEKSHYKLYKKGIDMLIRDTRTTLIWQHDISTEAMTWEASKQFCSHFDDGGYTDWRQPTIKELRRHIKGCSATEGSCVSYQGSGKKGFYWEKDVWDYRGDDFGVFWTSTLTQDKVPAVWIVSFYNGNVYPAAKTSINYVMCVR